MQMTVSHKQRLEDTIEALSDELKWGLRYFYAAKILLETNLRLTPTLFDTFYFSCLDQAGLILARMVIAKENNDASINLQYLSHQAQNKSALFHYAKQGEIKTLVKEQAQLFELHEPLIRTLKDQRDQNISHLDRRHVNEPKWRESQTQLDLVQVEKLYQDLIRVMTTYYRLFHGAKLDFGDWESASQAEVQNLAEYYEAYRSKV